MSNWNRALSLDNSKILGIINLSNDSFSGDGVFNKDAKLNKLLNSAKQKNINFIDVGCASTKPGFDSVTTEEEIKRLNYFIPNSNPPNKIIHIILGVLFYLLALLVSHEII